MGIYARIAERMDQRTKLMGQMMNVMDVDIVAAGMQVGGGALANAARACIACHSAGECQRWLADCAANGKTSEPDFCPNRTFFSFYRN